MSVLVAVGTQKGLFLLEGEAGGQWTQRGPFLEGQDVSAVAVDNRNGVAVFGGAEVLAPSFPPSPRKSAVYRSADRGKNWAVSTDGLRTVRIWTLEPGPDGQPGVVFAGCEPAAIFRSADAGATWAECEALSQQRKDENWHPGGGGLCLNSIVGGSSADELWVGVSVGGVRHSTDGGRTWNLLKSGMVEDCPDRGDDEPDMHAWIHT